ncbi:MAG: SGNH/GDSL hydrolase family protein [Acetobacteraceae bacterium]|nr:SGNH/GDSL hydrolase family protein [Acetobacteraceae bacterium]
MRRAAFLIACLALAMPGLARAECPVFRPAGPLVEAPLPGAGPLTVVALGSSSTEGAGASNPALTYPALLETKLRRALPGRPLRVVNAGRSGETSEEMLARLDRDVLSHRPALVVWQAGGNEVLRGRDPDSFRAVMRAGLERLRQAGIPVVLMDNQRAPRLLAAPGHERFDAILAELAELPGVSLFSRAGAMLSWQRAGHAPERLTAPDGLHMNDRGYACLADSLAAALLPELSSAAMAAR